MSLATTLQSLYNASELSTVLPDGFHRDFAPQKQTGAAFVPYAVFMIVASPLVLKYQAYTLSDPHTSQHVMFRVVGVGAAATEKLAKQVACVFANAPIPLDDGSMLNVVQNDLPVLRKQRQFGPGNVDVWQATFNVTYTTQESLVA